MSLGHSSQDTEDATIHNLIRMALPHDFGETLNFLDRRVTLIDRHTDENPKTRSRGALYPYLTEVKIQRRTRPIQSLLDLLEERFDDFWDAGLDTSNLPELEREFGFEFDPKFERIEELSREIGRLLDRVEASPRARRGLVRDTKAARALQDCRVAVDDLCYFSGRSKNYIKGMSKLLEFKIPEKLEKTNLNRFFTQQRTMQSFERYNAKLSIPIDLPTVDIDYSHCYSLFSNLIKNSMKYRRERIARMQVLYETTNNHAKLLLGSVPSFVPIGKVPDGFAAIHFIDYGIGVDTSRLESIFQPFKRGLTREQEAVFDSHTKEYQWSPEGEVSFSGVGIGLAIGARVTELYGGEIFARSKMGHGTSITILLPTNILH